MIIGENLIKSLTQIADIFLPRFCPACNTKLDINEDSVCKDCLNKIKISQPQRIEYEYQKKFSEEEIIKDFYSIYIFEKDKELQHIIHALKYNKRFKLGIFLGKILGKDISEQKRNWKFDFIIPVPLHQLRKAERGFNQSYYVAKGLGKIVMKPVVENAIKRKVYTESQTSMNLIERQENISGAFVVKNQKKFDGKSILLVDDVITTGATIAECGRTLMEAGADRIYAASIAIAD